MSIDNFLNNYFVSQFTNNFPVLLWSNILDFVDMGNFFQIFVTSRNTEVLIELNYWLRIYVPYILKSWNYSTKFNGFHEFIYLSRMFTLKTN